VVQLRLACLRRATIWKNADATSVTDSCRDMPGIPVIPRSAKIAVAGEDKRSSSTGTSSIRKSRP
jgi:hypothetical protein